MKTKLTLRLDSGLIEKTKEIAAMRKTSLSIMVAEFFKSLQDNYQVHTSTETSILNEISGIMSEQKDIENLSVGYDRRIRGKYL